MLFACVILWNSVALAELKAEIEGPMTARIGDLVVMSADRSVGAKSYKWRCIPDLQEGLIQVDQGRRLIFSRPEPGKYTFVLAVASADGDVDLDLHTLVVGESVEGVEVPQATTKAGGKKAPDVTKLAKQWIAKVPASATKDAERKVLAGTLRQMAALVDQEKVESGEELAQALAFSSESAMGQAFATWSPWFKEFGLLLDAEKEAGRLDTLGQFRDTYLAAAKGLD
jgi:hypothetical protein